jgi:hypothetical protein
VKSLSEARDCQPIRHNGCTTMLLTVTNTKSPATDLGYLPHKNPGRLQSFELSFGKTHVFYPDAAADRNTAAQWNGVRLDRPRQDDVQAYLDVPLIGLKVPPIPLRRSPARSTGLT